MKKILFLTNSYPDFRRSASVLCTHRVMEACAQSNDMEVHCLCLKYAGEANEELIAGVHVHRLPQTMFETAKYEASVRSNPSDKRKYHILDRIQKTIAIPLYPCISPFQLLKWKSETRKLQYQEQFDCVVAEHYGYNTLQTGLSLKQQFPDIKYIPLLWDPIAGQVITAKLPTAFTSKRISEEESQVSTAADKIISTLAMKEYYREHGDAARHKRIYLDIPSILPPEEEVKTVKLKLLNKDAINIVFSGYIDSHRDINPVLSVFNKSNYASRINVLFFSKGVSEKDKIYWKENFNGMILFHDYIPLTELHTIYRHADYLLNISSINPNLIPSKIFEYMSFGKPVISAYITEGDSAKRYLDKYPESCVIGLKNDPEELVLQLDSFLGKNHELVSFTLVSSLFPQNTPDSYVKAISEYLDDK